MPLSEQEQRLLEEMERSLYQNDSDFVARVTRRQGRPTYTSITLGVLGALAGVAIVILGLVMRQPLIGIRGHAGGRALRTPAGHGRSEGLDQGTADAVVRCTPRAGLRSFVERRVVHGPHERALGQAQRPGPVVLLHTPPRGRPITGRPRFFMPAGTGAPRCDGARLRKSSTSLPTPPRAADPRRSGGDRRAGGAPSLQVGPQNGGLRPFRGGLSPRSGGKWSTVEPVADRWS
jgi:hypothetical protein